MTDAGATTDMDQDAKTPIPGITLIQVGDLAQLALVSYLTTARYGIA